VNTFAGFPPRTPRRSARFLAIKPPATDLFVRRRIAFHISGHKVRGARSRHATNAAMRMTIQPARQPASQLTMVSNLSLV
jgi:hypothetical protein